MSLKDQAMEYLSRREHSAFELKQKLCAKGFQRDAITEVLVWLQEHHCQSDARFSEMLIRHKAHQGYGPRVIRAFLKSHQIQADIIAAAFEALQSELDFEALRQALMAKLQRQKKYQTSPAKAQQTVYQRGF